MDEDKNGGPTGILLNVGRHNTTLFNKFSVAIIMLICRVCRLVVQLWEFFS